MTVTVTPQSGAFNNAIALACSGLPKDSRLLVCARFHYSREQRRQLQQYVTEPSKDDNNKCRGTARSTSARPHRRRRAGAAACRARPGAGTEHATLV